MTLETSKPPRQLPKWLGLAVAIATMVLLVAGIGWWTWSFFTKPPPSELTEVTDREAMFRGAIDGVHEQRNNNGYVVRAGDVTVHVTKGKSDKDWNLRLVYSKPDLVPKECVAPLTARQQIAANPVWAKTLKLTPEQLKQVKAIPGGSGLILADADRDRVKSLWDAYMKASQQDKPAAENELIFQLHQIGKSSLAATRADIAERAKKVEAVLSPEQIAPFKQG